MADETTTKTKGCGCTSERCVGHAMGERGGERMPSGGRARKKLRRAKQEALSEPKTGPRVVRLSKPKAGEREVHLGDPQVGARSCTGSYPGSCGRSSACSDGRAIISSRRNSSSGSKLDTLRTNRKVSPFSAQKIGRKGGRPFSNFRLPTKATKTGGKWSTFGLSSAQIHPDDSSADFSPNAQGSSTISDAVQQAVEDFSKQPGLIQKLRSRSDVQSITFHYRSVQFDIDSSWLLQYIFDDAYQRHQNLDIRHGLVPSADEVIQVLWARYLSAANAQNIDFASFQDLVGCYNLPLDSLDDEFLFWSSGLATPMKVVEHMCGLLHTYYPSFTGEAPSTSGRWCDGLGYFADQLLRGNVANSNPDRTDKSCFLRLNFRNDDRLHAHTLGGRDQFFNPCAMTTSECLQPSSSNSAKRTWDAWKPVRFDHQYDAYIPSGVSSPVFFPGDETLRPSWAKSVASGSPSEFHVKFNPAVFGYASFLADRTLWLARMALAYWLSHPSRLLHLDAATKLAKYALRTITWLSTILLHEIGHLFAGGGHCRNERCYGIAQRFFTCKIVAELGLPLSPWEGSNDFPGTPASWSIPFSDEDGDDIQDAETPCSIDSVGNVGSGSVFVVSRNQCDG